MPLSEAEDTIDDSQADTAPISPDSSEDQGSDGERIITNRKRVTPGSTAFVPSVVGLIIAGEIVNELTGNEVSATNACRLGY